jgi:hypothetical protein
MGITTLGRITALIATAALGAGLVTALPAPAHAAMACEGLPSFDVAATIGSPYSYWDGRIEVRLMQWRLSDKTFVRVYNAPAGTQVTLRRSDGTVCGPRTVNSSGFADVGVLNNRSRGVWACISYPGGGSCGAAKWENANGD